MVTRSIYSFIVFFTILTNLLLPSSAQAASDPTVLALTGGEIVAVKTANLNRRPSRKAAAFIKAMFIDARWQLTLDGGLTFGVVGGEGPMVVEGKWDVLRKGPEAQLTSPLFTATLAPSKGMIFLAIAIDRQIGDLGWVKAEFTQAVQADDIATQQKLVALFTVHAADSAEIAALRTLDVTHLKDLYQGHALQNHLDMIEQLKTDQQYQKNRLLDARFDQVTVSAGGRYAEVHVVERWETAVYAQETNACQGYIAAQTLPQTVFLERMDKRWMVYAIKFDETTSPELGPCPAQK